MLPHRVHSFLIHGFLLIAAKPNAFELKTPFWSVTDQRRHNCRMNFLIASERNVHSESKAMEWLARTTRSTHAFPA
ncbi:uncharacterized protein B0J16DRAFT_347815 [Fusarium flagelliforme]|uniref:uncharacterized protein n=1 Tax=Fusarium flagelliforme TaxID=2675880 RepID=UPI001E8E51CA|nr:uncharacterized protein B0J16DRAFT_347815 [Fusarium flagelliforme]KAH7179839.1 hypothetical protein B0J16DRAFT_347815 [Fusarium flagelliforme]